MKKLFIVLILFLGSIITVGQVKTDSILPKRNTIYFEALGQGIFYLVAYDRLYRVNKKIKTSFTSSFTMIPAKGFLVLEAPVSYNFLFGRRKHHLELGLGFTLMYTREGNYYTSGNWGDVYFSDFGHHNNLYSVFSPKIGYRFQKPNGGFFMRITITSLIAGINRISYTQAGKFDPEHSWSYMEYFTSLPLFFEGTKAWMWPGISFGYTLKSK